MYHSNNVTLRPKHTSLS